MPKRRKPKKESTSWLVDAAKLMVHKGYTLRAASEELQVGLTKDEAEVITEKPEFLKALWEERFRYFAFVGENVERTRFAIVGRHEVLIQKLIDEEKWKPAADANLELARMEGFLQKDAVNVNVFGLSQAEFDELKRSLQEGEVVGEDSNSSGASKTLPN